MSPNDIDKIIAGFNNNSSLLAISCAGGTTYYASGSHPGLSGTSFVPRQDTVISVLTGKLNSTGENVDLLTQMGISGITLLKDELWKAPNNMRIVAITIDSGTIRLYS